MWRRDAKSSGGREGEPEVETQQGVALWNHLELLPPSGLERSLEEDEEVEEAMRHEDFKREEESTGERVEFCWHVVAEKLPPLRWQ
jgi:hypothetical protein